MACDRREVERPVERAVAAADDEQALAAELLHLAHGVEHRLFLIGLDARDRRALGLERAAAGRDHHHLAFELLAGVGLHPEQRVADLLDRLDHLLQMELGAERLDLRKQALDQALPGAEGNAGDVVDRLLGIELGALAADLVQDVDEMRLHVEEAELEHREQPAGPRPDDEHVGLDQFSHTSSASRINAPILQGKAADRNYLRGCLASAEPQEKGGFRTGAAYFRRAQTRRPRPEFAAMNAWTHRNYYLCGSAAEVIALRSLPVRSLSGGPVARAKPQVFTPQAPAQAATADRGVSVAGSRHHSLWRRRPAGPRQQRGLLDLLRDRAGRDHSSSDAGAAGSGRDLRARAHRDRLSARAALAGHGRDRHRRRGLWPQLL